METVVFVDRHTVRRRISRHFKLPEEQYRPYFGNNDELSIRLPLFGIPKGQFISCDLIDEGGRRVSLPPLPERALHSSAALYQLALQILGQKDKAVKALISGFVTAGPRRAEETLQEARHHPAMSWLFADQHFDYLATYLAHNFLVFVDVPATEDTTAQGGRIIRFELDVRFAHKRRELKQLRSVAGSHRGSPATSWSTSAKGVKKWVPGPMRTVFRFLGLMSHPYHHFVAVDGAGSLHLDVEATEGLAFGKRRLRFRDTTDSVYTAEGFGSSSRRARFLVPRTKGRGAAAMTIFIRPAPGLLRNGSFILLLGFAVLLYVINQHYDDLIGHTAKSSAAIPLLLLLPGFVSVVTARPNEHPYVSGVLVGIRVLTIVPIPLGIIAIFVLIFSGSSWILLASAIISAFCGIILLLGRLIDELVVKPGLGEFVEDDMTRVG